MHFDARITIISFDANARMAVLLLFLVVVVVVTVTVQWVDGNGSNDAKVVMVSVL